MGGKGSGNRTTSNPFVANKPSAVDPDSNARTIAFTKELYKLPPVDHSSEEEEEARIDLFFDICAKHGMRPMVGGLALALGMSKRTMWSVVTDERSGSRLGFTPETKQVLKKAMNYIDATFEQILMDAKNPVPAIFYTKSNLGWREAASETVITHRSEKPQLEGRTTEEIAAGIAELVGVEDVKKLTD